MRLRPWVIDAFVALVIAAIVVIVSPGPAVDGLLALFVLLICGLTLLVDSLLARRRRRATRRIRRPPGPTTYP